MKKRCLFSYSCLRWNSTLIQRLIEARSAKSQNTCLVWIQPHTSPSASTAITFMVRIETMRTSALVVILRMSHKPYSHLQTCTRHDTYSWYHATDGTLYTWVSQNFLAKSHQFCWSPPKNYFIWRTPYTQLAVTFQVFWINAKHLLLKHFFFCQ